MLTNSLRRATSDRRACRIFAVRVIEPRSSRANTATAAIWTKGERQCGTHSVSGYGAIYHGQGSCPSRAIQRSSMRETVFLDQTAESTALFAGFPSGMRYVSFVPRQQLLDKISLKGVHRVAASFFEN